MTRWILPLLSLGALVAQAPHYAGPVPEKPDVPYLLQAGNLLAAEAVALKEEKQADDTLYTIAGEASPASTPLPLPVFIFQSDRIDPLKFRVFKLLVGDGHRRITASAMKSADVIHMSVTRLAPGLFRLEVSDALDNGEYMMAAEGAAQAFCFSVH